MVEVGGGGILHEMHWHTPMAFIQDRPLGYFTHVSITTPVVQYAVISALKNYHTQGFLEVPADILKHFWIQVAVSEMKRPLRASSRFGSGALAHFSELGQVRAPQILRYFTHISITTPVVSALKNYYI